MDNHDPPCEEGTLSHAPHGVIWPEGPGFCRLRDLTLSPVASSDLRQVPPARNSLLLLYTGWFRFLRFPTSIDTFKLRIELLYLRQDRGP